jgi:hypothetical protein
MFQFPMHHIFAFFATNVLLGIQKSGLNKGNWLPTVQIVILPTSQVLHEVENFGNI